MVIFDVAGCIFSDLRFVFCIQNDSVQISFNGDSFES